MSIYIGTLSTKTTRTSKTAVGLGRGRRPRVSAIGFVFGHIFVLFVFFINPGDKRDWLKLPFSLSQGPLNCPEKEV